MEQVIRELIEARIRALHQELTTLQEALVNGAAAPETQKRPATPPARRTRRPMSAAEKKAASRRMKAIWAAKRSEKAKAVR
jgi:hypothetical protein